MKQKKRKREKNKARQAGSRGSASPLEPQCMRIADRLDSWIARNQADGAGDVCNSDPTCTCQQEQFHAAILERIKTE